MSGVVLLNEKDMNRLPKDFLARLEKCGVKAELSKRRVTLKADLFLNAVTLKKTWTSRQYCPKSVTLSRIL